MTFNDPREPCEGSHTKFQSELNLTTFYMNLGTMNNILSTMSNINLFLSGTGKCYQQTLNTLQHASLARNVKNKAKVNLVSVTWK